MKKAGTTTPVPFFQRNAPLGTKLSYKHTGPYGSRHISIQQNMPMQQPFDGQQILIQTINTCTRTTELPPTALQRRAQFGFAHGMNEEVLADQQHRKCYGSSCAYYKFYSCRILQLLALLPEREGRTIHRAIPNFSLPA
jgi:hypothetical protein